MGLFHEVESLIRAQDAGVPSGNHRCAERFQSHSTKGETTSGTIHRTPVKSSLVPQRLASRDSTSFEGLLHLAGQSLAATGKGSGTGRSHSQEALYCSPISKRRLREWRG
jgi:hypothetical protein